MNINLWSLIFERWFLNVGFFNIDFWILNCFWTHLKKVSGIQTFVASVIVKYLILSDKKKHPLFFHFLKVKIWVILFNYRMSYSGQGWFLRRKVHFSGLHEFIFYQEQYHERANLLLIWALVQICQFEFDHFQYWIFQKTIIRAILMKQ